jgi:uncharacterized cupredoxin-like copper-binding protein
MMRARFAVAALALAGLPAAGAVAADLVQVRLVDDKFDPAEIVLEHGKPYRLHIENVGHEMHEFFARTFFHAAQVPDAASVLSNEASEIVLQPGQSRDIDLVAPAPGTYELTCPDHDWDGMVGKIVVR